MVANRGIVGGGEFPTLVHVLRARAEQEPDRLAYGFLNGALELESFATYGMVDEQARAVAALLSTLSTGDIRGQRVLLAYPPGLEYIYAFLGCLYAGAVAVPAYPPSRAGRSLPRLRSIVADSQAKVALSTSRIVATVSALAGELDELAGLQWLDTSALDSGPLARGDLLPTPAALAFLQYTSGSTSSPKGVMVTHANIMANEAMIGAAFQSGPDDVGIGWLPLFHDMGLIGNILHTLFQGFPLYMLSQLSFLQKPMRWLEAISRYRGTLSGGPNFAYELCIQKSTEAQRNALSLDCWRVAFTGAEPIRPKTLAQFAEAFAGGGFRRAAYLPCYGLAEATLIAFGGSNGQLSLTSVGGGERLLVGSGRPFHDGVGRIVDPVTSVPCADDVEGEIWLAGPHVAAGYWNRPELSHATFGARLADGGGPYLRTGDLGVCKAGEFFVTGRLKDMIILRGENHYPQDVELSVEEAHPDVRVGCVAAFADAEEEEGLCLLVEVRRRLGEIEHRQIAAAIRAQVIAEHGISPRTIVLGEAGCTPKTSSGKVQRQQARRSWLSGELDALYVSRVSVESSPPGAPAAVPPEQGLVQWDALPERERALVAGRWLCEWVARRMQCTREQVDVASTFAGLGLDSVACVALTGDLGAWSGLSVVPTKAYEYPTIAQLSAWVAAAVARQVTVDADAEANLDSPIAVIGMACRVPQADDPDGLARVLWESRDAISDLTRERFDVDAHYASEPHPGKMCTKRAGLLANVRRFDAGFFGISDREAIAMDPQQRLLLEVAWEALESSGRAPDALQGTRTGVYIGICGSEYADRVLQAGRSQIDPYVGTGNTSSVAAGRISYALGLRGPSMAIDTACSSSLVAIHLAAQALRTGEAELALAGGVNLIVGPERSIYLSAVGALSPDGKCKAFDEGADGYVRGEGCGLVVLKPLATALADQDPVLAVIRGSAVNQDGKSNGLTAPNGGAQRAVIRSALARAGLHAQDLSYVEAHGTGTQLGDPIEMAALGEVLAGRADERKVLVGSVKTNLGHLEAAAGVTGLIKVILALQHESIPPNLHFEQPSSLIPWSELPVEVPTRVVPWPRRQRPRVAGVSSFGLSGTNAHVILMEAPSPPPRPAAWASPWQALCLSGQSEASLRLLATRFGDWITRHPEVPLPDICARACLRSTFAHRAVFVVTTVEELCRQLVAFGASGQGASAAGHVVSAAPPRIGFLFSGQGSQYAGMAKQLDAAVPIFREALDRCAAVLEPLIGRELRPLLFQGAPFEGGPGEPELDQTAYTQPALFAIEYALGLLWRSLGVEPAALLGHSVGEYAAACLASVLPLEAAARLVVARGRLMQDLSPPGAMLVVQAGAAQVWGVVEPLSSSLAIAAHNSPSQTVVSGTVEAIAQVRAAFEAAGVRTRRLPGSRAFHSPLMDRVADQFAPVLAGIDALASPQLAIASTLTGTLAGAEELASPAYWQRQLREPVRCADALAVLEGMGIEAMIEIGPGSVLLGLHRQAIGAAPSLRIPSLQADVDDVQQLLSGLASLWVRGTDVHWRALMSSKGVPALQLPTYAFVGADYWLDAVVARGAEPASRSTRPATAPLAEQNGRSNHASSSVPDRTSPGRSRGAIRQRLQEIVGDLLRVAPTAIDARAPLVDVGADSLVLVEGMQRVQREFGVRISVRDIFEKLTTIDALAEHLEVQAPVSTTLGHARLGLIQNGKGDIRDGERPGVAKEGSTLSAGQMKHIDLLAGRRTALTPGSRRRRAESHHLADVRSSAGYRASYPPAVRELWTATRQMCYPIVARRSYGSRIWDIDDNEYVDFTMGFGVHLFGHNPPWLTRALSEQLERGVHIGPQAEHATAVAAGIVELTGVERVCFCSSGSDAVMLALRLARAEVGRPKIAAFAGSYHGSFDGVLGTIPMLLGASPGMEHDVLILEYGHPSALEMLARHAHEIAGVLVEPVQSRRPDLQPREFLHALRALTREHGMALIFDEVLVGFRICPGGAQRWFGVDADIVTYGKIIGGGLPIGVVAGRHEFLDRVDGGAWDYDDGSMPRVEPVWFAGTFNKNPLGMAAALAAVEHLGDQGPALQESLNERVSNLATGLNGWFAEQRLPLEVVHFGSMFRIRAPRSCDLLYQHLLERRLYVWEGRSMFLSTAHTEDDIHRLVAGIEDAVGELRKGDFLPARTTPVKPQPELGASIVARPRARPHAALRLFCFPYAGGSSAIYRRWLTHLPYEVEPNLVQLPGREARHAEPAAVDFEMLASSLTELLLPHLERPFALYGHSMGALLAYEVARRLDEQHGINARMLIVSGEGAPHLPRQSISPPLHTLSDEALISELLLRHGAPVELTKRRDLLEELLPLLRADLAVCESYRSTGVAKLSCPIVAFGGHEDPLVGVGDLAAWTELTSSAKCSIHMLAGDHFFFRSSGDAMFRGIGQHLSTLFEAQQAFTATGGHAAS